MLDPRLSRGIDGCKCQRCTFDRVFNRDRGRDLEVRGDLVVLDREDLADIVAMERPTRLADVPEFQALARRSYLALAMARRAGHPVAG